MYDLDQLIARSFGIADLLFALHPIEHEHAIRMIEYAVKLNLTREELGGRIFNFLQSQNVNSEHRTMQMNVVNLFLDNNFPAQQV